MKRLLYILVFTLGFSCFATAQGDKTAVNPIDAKDFPKGVVTKGDVKQAFTWTDNSGEHLLVMCEKETLRNDLVNAELFAYHYLVKDNVAEQTWRTYDYVYDCIVDHKANFIPDSACVTDLDSDGETEIWLVYLVGCKGDVSPWKMKIIMHEGTKKYAVRGRQRVPVDMDADGNFVYDGGECDYDFTSKIFRTFASELWDRYSNPQQQQ